MYKKFLCVLLTASIAMSTVVTAYADKESDLKERRSEAQEELGETNDRLSSLVAQQHEIQSQIDDINAENSSLADAGMLSIFEIPNSEMRISSEKGAANVLKSPFTLPLMKASTQFCTEDVGFAGNLSNISDVKFAFMHWLIFVILSP